MRLGDDYFQWISRQNISWHWFMTATFRHPVDFETARRRFVSWIRVVSRKALGARRGRQRDVPYVFAVEPHKTGDPHLHAAVADVAHLGDEGRRLHRDLWFAQNGIARLDPYNPGLDGLGYIVKHAGGSGVVEVGREVFL